MKELINNELLQLQQDLENLKSASEMISEAGRASDSVIEEAKNIHKEFSESLDRLSSLYQQYVSEFGKAADKSLRELGALSAEKISEQTALSKKSAEEAASKIELVKSTYLSQTAKTDKLLNSYLELAQSTTELKDKISGIDFPARFENMNKLLTNLASTQEKYNTENEKIGKLLTENKALRQAQKNEQAISSLKGLLWTVIILLLAIVGAGVFFYLKTR